MFKFNANKVKQKLEEEKKRLEEASFGKKDKDIHKDPLVKVDGPGEYLFRAFPYLHNEDFLSDPFALRFYHFGIPGVGTVYCPQKNSFNKQRCAICDFVWTQMKENKGIKEETDKWKKFLPKRRLFIPGILRGRENEGVKFLQLSTNDNKPGEHHELLIKWLTKESTQDFLDPVNGFDLILTYEEYDAAKSKLLNGAKFGFKSIDLDRDRVPLSENIEEFWSDIEKNLKNIDKDIPGYEVKTTEDTIEVLERWSSKLERAAARNKKVDERKDGVGTVASSSPEPNEETVVSDDDKPVTVSKVEETSSTTKSSEDRKARARALLKNTALT
jgi:hypothetical protein